MLTLLLQLAIQSHFGSATLFWGLTLIGSSLTRSKRCTPFLIDIYMAVMQYTITYDHRLWNTGHPVRSAIHKPQIGRLVVGWVTTSEYLLLYVFLFVNCSGQLTTHYGKESPLLFDGNENGTLFNYYIFICFCRGKFPKFVSVFVEDNDIIRFGLKQDSIYHYHNTTSSTLL